MKNADFCMELKRAECPVKVAEIVDKTIRADIYFAVVQGEIVGTGSIRGNEICRLFILPEYQGNGYGSRLMDLLEDMVFRQYQVIHIDASFPAESMYLKRGYRIETYEKIETESGDYLCYHTMEKMAEGELEIYRKDLK